MKLNLLFLSSRLPYPPISGSRLKNYWLLTILSRYYNVHLVSIAEEDVPVEFYDWANSLGITYKIFRKTKFNFYLNTLKGLTNSLPFQVNYYYFNDMQRYVDSIYSDYDFIISTLIRTAQYVIDKDKPKILDMVDSIGLNYLNSSKKTSSKFWKVIYSVESKRALKYENHCIEVFDKTLFFNKEEEKYYRNPKKTTWMPHGVNSALFDYEKTDGQYRNWIVFFGKMDYQPNVDAAIWFIENVLPYLDKNFVFGIVGAYPAKKLVEYAERNERIEVTGFMDDPYVILKSALCVVAPMQTGGGIQNKVLESMALGTINIVSSLAAKPIGGVNRVHFIIEDDPKEIANIIFDIYRNPEKYKAIKESSRQYIEENFTWDIYEKKLLFVINEVLSTKKASI